MDLSKVDILVLCGFNVESLRNRIKPNKLVFINFRSVDRADVWSLYNSERIQ